MMKSTLLRLTFLFAVLYLTADSLYAQTSGGYVKKNTAKAQSTAKRTVSRPATKASANSKYITFKDRNVEVICLKRFDTDGDGRLSKEEAADVLALPNEMFYNNKDILSFDELQYFTGLMRIGDNAFSCCENLTRVVLPASVTAIGKSAFYRTAINSIVIPSGVTRLEERTFEDCKSLVKVTLPDNLKYIGNLCFRGCISLMSIQIPNTVTIIGNTAFSSCESLMKANLPSSLTELGEFAFYKCTSLSSPIVIPVGLRVIKYATFNYCQIPSIEFAGNSLVTIEKSSFSECKQLETLRIPEGVKSIGEWAFSSCKNLKELILPSTLEKIDKYAFYQLSQITSITIPSNVKYIGHGVFADMESLREIHFKSATPPTMTREHTWNAVSGLPSQAVLYVPMSAVNAYKQANIEVGDGNNSKSPATIIGE